MGVPLTTEEYVKRHKADLQALGFDSKRPKTDLVI